MENSSSGRELHSEHDHAPNRFAVLSTSERAGGAEGEGERLAGRGVTLAFVDSGFHPHPDITQPANRVAAYHDVWDPGAVLSAVETPRADDWHGTQTCVAAAGNGFLSGGAYRGLACEARLVLVRVGRDGRVSEDGIARGLEWVLANRERHGIRVVSMSLGGDEDRPLAESRVNRLAEEAVAAGMVLVAAAGNSGCSERHRCLPPATAPSVIAVGGYDDRNDPERRRLQAYCSSFGVTADGLVKPEIIAPAMWIAAPILPGTETYARAEALSRLAQTPDNRLRRTLLEIGPELLGQPSAAAEDELETLRARIDGRLRAEKIVAAHYQHVDGTSFAAPIAASVVALMLEANPALSPAAVRRILLQTADRAGELSAMRQGYGVLNPRAAIDAARREAHGEAGGRAPRAGETTVRFAFHDDSATRVEVAGDFNGWEASRCPLSRGGGGDWVVEVPLPPPGLYRYKLRVDGERWIADPANALREPDPYGGFNSVLEVAPPPGSDPAR
ncbi:MAG TPA: S8 family serine peptidase [Thermoanaerobaculia bacterium]|jgi:serine protease AprX